VSPLYKLIIRLTLGGYRNCHMLRSSAVTNSGADYDAYRVISLAMLLARTIRRVPYFFAFGGTIASLALFAIRNLTTFLAAILIVSPVAGFLPMRAFRSTLTKRPRPGTTKRPFFLTSLIAVSDRAGE
jgi:hypothetical protein